MLQMEYDIKYPSLTSVYDTRYKARIPTREDVIDRSHNPLFTSYEEVYEAEFPHKKFEPRAIPGKGRGLIALEDIKKGEMVFKEKATLLFVGEEDDEESNKDSTFYMARDVYIQKAFCTLDFALQLAQNPNRNAEFEEHVKFITETLRNDPEVKYEVKKEDVLKVVNGIHTNSFSLDFVDGYAVFIACSLANHSCCENVGWHTVGDVMYWTALTDIKKDTEITLSYTFPSIRPKRIKYFQDNYGFTCDCPMCRAPHDPWRAFKCSCGGIIFPEPEGFICHTCHVCATEEEIEEFKKEENFMLEMDKNKRHRRYYNPLRKMHDTHLYMFRAVKKYISMKACANPLQLFKEYLIPVSKYQVSFSHGRIYPAMLEQYGVTCMKYSRTMPDLLNYLKEEALASFKTAYEYRCTLGMGVTGYAAAVFKEHIAILNPDNLASFTEYDEF
ncbi:hypothetical protein EIN_229240 [Entamoeba invadens IP1]|uniref:SET domain-containing protein n=1 Tax=Entamoeba invadens IP1 TaxID=370355 RepID=A0A0A1U2V9_ENTIV|nr:hypothetical protein EIN_229240 [Entamoeba invadens IP1]ELP88401.1 hypothetical protein EIN_229240 [Entamoeba invadens IP1]|eukprot:XP_004255172.1 hypothetical protein EIN_229240 [Entamoeba invadens IP1]